MLQSSVFLIDWKWKCCLGNSLYLDFLGGGKMLVQVGYGKERLLSYQPPTTNPVFPKRKFHNSHYCNNLCNLCYYCCSKIYLFMTVELSYNQHNNTVSLISQVLIGPYLIHSVHPRPPHPPSSLSGGTCQGLNFSRRFLGKSGWPFLGRETGSFCVKK